MGVVADSFSLSDLAAMLCVDVLAEKLNEKLGSCCLLSELLTSCVVVNDDDEPKTEVEPLPNLRAENPPAALGAPKMEPVAGAGAVVAGTVEAEDGLLVSKVGNKLFWAIDVGC